MLKSTVILFFLFQFFLLHGQDEAELFRSTFYSNFFGVKIQSVAGSLNSYRTSSCYWGRDLKEPRDYELYGHSSRELKCVEFEYKLIEVDEPKNLEVVKKYHLHKSNYSKYATFFDTITGDWKTDSIFRLDSLLRVDIQLSSHFPENEIGIYHDLKANKYYIKSGRYCAFVRIKLTSGLKGKRFLKRYNYKIEKNELCQQLLSTIQFCDNAYLFEDKDWTLNVKCYDLYGF